MANVSQHGFQGQFMNQQNNHYYQPDEHQNSDFGGTAQYLPELPQESSAPCSTEYVSCGVTDDVAGSHQTPEQEETLTHSEEVPVYFQPAKIRYFKIFIIINKTNQFLIIFFCELGNSLKIHLLVSFNCNWIMEEIVRKRCLRVPSVAM